MRLIDWFLKIQTVERNCRVLKKLLYVNKIFYASLMPTVSSSTWRPAGKVLVRGSEDGHETPGATGAARGSGLPPVNDCYPEGLRNEEWQWGCRTSWTLLVLISRTTQGKDFALKPRFTWGRWYLSLRNKKETIELSSFAILFLCVRVCDVWVFWALDVYCFYHVSLRQIVFRHMCFEVTGGRKKPFTDKS